MRLGTLIAGILLCQAGQACAGSFAVLTKSERADTPSFVYFGEAPRPPAARPAHAVPLEHPHRRAPSVVATGRPEMHRISASVIAYGKPDVEDMAVASVRKERMRDPHLPIMVMRGGLSGDAAPSGAGQQAAPTPAPARTTASAAPSHSSGGSPQPKPQPKAPPPPEPAVAPPPRATTHIK